MKKLLIVLILGLFTFYGCAQMAVRRLKGCKKGSNEQKGIWAKRDDGDMMEMMIKCQG